MTAPFCWLERPGAAGGPNAIEALGGRDALGAWAAAECADVPSIVELATGVPANSEAFFDKSPGTAATS